MTTISKNSQLLATAKTIKGTSFVGLRNYTNSQGETSNYTVLVGINFENVLKNDMKSLIENKKSIVAELLKTYKSEVIEKAFENVFTSLEKRLSSEAEKEVLRQQNDLTISKSDAQIDAYHHLAKGVKLHIDTLKIHIFGLVVKKTVLQAVEYKAVNSRELTIVQNKIKKLANFKQEKYRTFIFDKTDLKMQGIEL
jgi:hypothetical protein